MRALDWPSTIHPSTLYQFRLPIPGPSIDLDQFSSHSAPPFPRLSIKLDQPRSTLDQFQLPPSPWKMQRSRTIQALVLESSATTLSTALDTWEPITSRDDSRELPWTCRDDSKRVPQGLGIAWDDLQRSSTTFQKDSQELHFPLDLPESPGGRLRARKIRSWS